MTRAIQLAKLALLLTAAGLCALLGLLAWRATSAIIDLSHEVRSTVSSLNPAIQNLGAATAEWSAASKAQAQSVTGIERDVRVEMWQLDRTLQAAQGTLRATRATIAAVGADADAARSAVDSAKAATDNLGGALAQATATEAALSKATQDLDGRITDKRLDELLTHFDSMSASGDKMLADAQWKEHQLLHPEKRKVGFWGAAEAGVLWVHRLMPPIF